MKRLRDLSPAPARKRKRKSADAKPWYHDKMCVLFETPSGFAILYCCASLIDGPDVMKALWDNFTKISDARCLVWLKQFKTFEDKSSAIQKNAGVDETLSDMIKKWLPPWMKLAVGKPEYKKIIEESLKIPCVDGQAVMELMWGIENCMQSLVPGEEKKLTKADRLPISQGLLAVLSRYDCVVKPEMVTELIIKTASALFRCDSFEKQNTIPLRSVGCIIKIVSGINCDNWNLLKIVTAMKAIWWPEEIGYYWEEISRDEVSRLVKDRQKYEVLLDKDGCFGMYDEMMSAYVVRVTNKELLKFLVEEANASEAKQAAEAGAAVELV